MSSPATAIRGAVAAVTKDWAKQRKAEERDRNAALRRYERLVPADRVTLRQAAFAVMEEAYLTASDNGSLPVKPRQIMYAARPSILADTGERDFSDSYFTQSLLIDYMEEYYCHDWDIIWDARGHFLEPHTGREVALGTLEVRQYLGERPSFKTSTTESLLPMFPTAGPQHRFRNVLFIEKEGFHQILDAARLQERFDISLMSTKGMSVTAARMLIDQLSPHLDNVFVLHDFDRSGFSILGTLGTDSRRYSFKNEVHIFDLGLRLTDVEAMDLQSEPVPEVSVWEWRARAATLRRHHASPAEIEFLRSRRVELNAMTSRQLVNFIEAKLTEHGVGKLVPDDATIEQQARRCLVEQLSREAMAKIAKDIEAKAMATKLPRNLRGRLEAELRDNPELPWDLAVAKILGGGRK